MFLGSRVVKEDGSEGKWTESPSAIRIFAGLLPYERGGEPINDFQRYELLSKSMVQPNTEAPNDYKALMSVGPFFMGYGTTLLLDFAYTAGEGLEDFLDNAAFMKLMYNGTWIDKDKNPSTGVNGREAIFIGDEGSAKNGIYPDPCNSDEKVKVAVRDTLWVNGDCYEETQLWNHPDCFKGTMTFQNFKTGINGRETQMFWVTSVTPRRPACAPSSATASSA